MTSSSIPADLPGQPSGARFRLVVTALIIAEITCALETNMINVALAHLYGVYGDPVHVGWLLTAFSLTAAGSSALCGRLGDLFGRKRVLLILLGVAFVGSSISAVASDLNVIIFGRVLQGVSMAILPLAFGILRENAAKEQIAMGVGILGSVYSISTGAGIVLGGLIVDTGYWQGIFVVSAGVAVVALALVWLVLPGRAGRRPEGPLDLVGGVIFVVPIAALLLGLTNIKSQFWSAPVTWGLMIGGVVGLVAWARHELRQPNPLIDVRLLRTPRIAIVNAVIFFTALGPILYVLLLMPLLQQPLWTGIGLGLTATVAALMKLPTNFTAAAGALAAGFAARRWGMRPVIILAALVSFAAYVLLIFKHDTTLFILVVSIGMIAPAITVINACAPGLILEAAPEDRSSEATGLSQVAKTVGMACGSLMLAYTLGSSRVTNSQGVHFPDERAYLLSFVVVAVCGLLSLLAALSIPRQAPKP